jgi:ubiquinone/menaquinone biosynthesis C-methylase UbiE
MERTPQEVKRLIAQSYDRIAERYLEWRAEQHREGAAQWTALLGGRLEQRSSVLDVGCGARIPLTRMPAETFDVTGVDISTRQIELARRNEPNARFISADICSLDFPPESFNAAVGSYSFIHVPRSEHEALLRKIAR